MRLERLSSVLMMAATDNTGSSLRDGWTRRAWLRIHHRCCRRETIGGRGQLDFTGILRGLHDDLRQAVEQAARPRRGSDMADDLHVHVGIQAALGNAVVNAHGDDIVANVEKFFNVENWLRLPVMRFADEWVVHEIPALVVAAAEADERAFAVHVLFR